ncbi:RHE_PE00001 family protein [Beijerinckia sp. L45]|uniref:RHE_PE00001 family protein n=1 Tax=Beijerinckia sp. L45 TaxID=1641855 RepID=UPI00131E708B|nr:RHE_PE00001 family protein [Beijerinckia sp. L45]
MTYTLPDPIPWSKLSGPLARAEDALARLDQTLAKSPIRAGWSARTHFADAAASLWLDGSLIAQDDLVLHDARMDIRVPTHELVRAHAVLRARRRIASEPDPAWALSAAGLAALRDRVGSDATQGRAVTPDPGDTDADEDDLSSASGEPDEDDPLAAELAALDALIARSDRVLAGERSNRPEPENKEIILYDLDWDEDSRLAEWQDVLRQTRDLPPVLAAVLAMQAWTAIEPLQRAPWLGRLLVPALLKARGKTRAHLLTLNCGLKAVLRERRMHRDPTIRLLALIEGIQAAADQGVKDHDRWLLAREILQRRLVGRRINSSLPAVIDLVMARPLVSARLIAQECGVSQRGALDLVAALCLREATGRGRYRAWGVL